MPGSVIAHHRRFCHQHAVFVEREDPARPAAQWLHCEIAASAGQGWMDLGEIAHGLTVGRSRYALSLPWQCEYKEPEATGLGVYVLLSGQARASLDGHSPAQPMTGGTVYLCDRARMPETIGFRQAARTPFEGVTFTLPAALVAELAADVPALATLAQRPGYLPLPRGQAGIGMMQMARQMLDISACTSIARLHLESRALELTALLAGLVAACTASAKTCLPHRQQVAVDETLHILECEWMSAHTISGLSRRVQLNECYLKTAFRVSTGHSIAQYLRRVRMRHAHRLLEDTGTTVLQAAAFVGYSNPSHFAAAFKTVYGMLPSALKR